MADEDALRKIRAVEEQIEYLQKKLAMAKQVGALSCLVRFLRKRYFQVSYRQCSLLFHSSLFLFVTMFFSYMYICFYTEVFHSLLFCLMYL